MIDAKLSSVEQSFATPAIKTPKEVFDAIPTLKLLSSSQMLKEVQPGAYQFVGITVDELPVLEWFQLSNLCGIPLPTTKGKKSRKKGSK